MSATTLLEGPHGQLEIRPAKVKDVFEFDLTQPGKPEEVDLAAVASIHRTVAQRLVDALTKELIRLVD